MFLLMIDAHSKWLEVHTTSSTTSATTTELMRSSFAALGLPEVIVSDNALVFTSEEFHKDEWGKAYPNTAIPPCFEWVGGVYC